MIGHFVLAMDSDLVWLSQHLTFKLFKLSVFSFLGCHTSSIFNNALLVGQSMYIRLYTVYNIINVYIHHYN